MSSGWLPTLHPIPSTVVLLVLGTWDVVPDSLVFIYIFIMIYGGWEGDGAWMNDCGDGYYL